MGHYARVEDGVVTDVIVADKTYIDTLDDAQMWVKTSYNTRRGVHYDPETGEPSADQSKALRKNYAGIGMVYDAENDMFYGEQRYASWTLNLEVGDWEPPIPMPEVGDRQGARWDEDLYQSDNTQGWVVYDFE